MEKIIIQTSEKNPRCFDVIYGNRMADGIGYDEMLGLVSAITMPEERPCLQWLWTKEQREDFEKRLNEIHNNTDEELF